MAQAVRERFRFRGMEFPCNPKSVTVKRERKLLRFLCPGSAGVVQDMGLLPAVITGEGEFFGAEADRDFERLSRLFDEGAAGILQIPGQQPLHAWPASLSMIKKAGPAVVAYRFTFTEKLQA